MQPHQQRVIDEKRELDDKISRLVPFLSSDTFKTIPPAEQGRLKRQSRIMQEYADVLGERIGEFTEEQAAKQ